MTQKLFCICAAAALLVAVSTANVASAHDLADPTAPVAACPCEFAPAPCGLVCYGKGCCPPVTYRVGLFGVIRPVVYTPVYRPVVVPAPVYRPRLVARYAACPPYPACPPVYTVPYCW